MQFQPTFIERILLVIPWVFPVWLIAKGMNDEIDGLLVFVLVVITIPIIIFINIVTIVFVRGKKALKQFKKAAQGESSKKTLKSTNYSELPWWDPRKWTK